MRIVLSSRGELLATVASTIRGHEARLRSERRIVMPVQKPGRSIQDVETDPLLMTAVQKRFGRIVFDLAASKDNKQADLFFSKKDNSLNKKWGAGSSIIPKGHRWLNPPFGKIAPWARKCAMTVGHLPFGSLLFFLVPASIGSNWYADHVHDQALVLGLRPRLRFVGHKQRYPKDCILAVYGEKPGFELWDWRMR